MKIIIEHSDTKREIDGSFNICGSYNDLKSIVDQINVELETTFSYGWVTIILDKQKSIKNTPPKNWDE
jgi:hypothetical protein